MNTATVETDDGVNLHYVVHGGGSAAVIYLHAMAGEASHWPVLWAVMNTPAFRHVALDFRGHGRSVCEPCILTNERLARDVIAVADAASLERFTVVGHSLGGKVGMKLAAMVPNRVDALVLLGTPGPGFVPFRREDMAELFSTYHDVNVARAFFQGWFNTTTSHIEAWVEAFSRYPDWLMHATAEMAIWSDITPEVAGRIVAPTLIVAGRDDPVYGPGYQRSDVLPFVSHAEMVELADCGHGFQLERPEAVGAVINRFFESLQRAVTS